MVLSISPRRRGVNWSFLAHLADRGQLQWLKIGPGECPPAEVVERIVAQCKVGTENW